MLPYVEVTVTPPKPQPPENERVEQVTLVMSADDARRLRTFLGSLYGPSFLSHAFRALEEALAPIFGESYGDNKYRKEVYCVFRAQPQHR